MRISAGGLLLALFTSGFGIFPSMPAAAQAGDQAVPKPSAKPVRKTKPAGKRPAKPAPAPAAPFVLPEPPLPVQQLSQLGATPCATLVDQMSRGSLNSKYDVQSGWNRQAPVQHVFQSVAVIERPEVAPANGLAAIIAAPTSASSCDGVIVQIFPLASDCQTAQNYMRSAGATAIPILSTQIMIDRNGKRVFLLPGVNKTCTAVSVDSSFGLPPRQAAQPPAASGPAIPMPAPSAIVPHTAPVTPSSSEILPTAQPPK